MSAKLKLSIAAAAVALLAVSGGAVDIARLPDISSDWILGAAAAESGGHTSGGSSGGGHDSGSSHSSGGGHSSGKGGGHSGAGEVPGAENKGHGLKKGHEGHASGRHQGVQSAHDAGARRFAGGSGTTADATVPEGLGRYGAGAANAQGRLRYWGGWTLPGTVDPTDYTDPTDSTTIASADLIPAGGGGGASVNVRTLLPSAARCDNVGGASTSMAQRLSGENLDRIGSAQALLDPAATMERPGANPYLLATLQEELQKPSPDLAVAGLYIGLIAKGSVSVAKIKSVGARLCVPVSDTQAEQIAQAAEQQRVAIK